MAAHANDVWCMLAYEVEKRRAPTTLVQIVYPVRVPTMNKNKASGVSWVKPAEPSFLKKFKNDANYQEGPNVDTKV